MSTMTEHFVHFTNDDGNREYLGSYSTKEQAQQAVNSLYEKGYTDAQFEVFSVDQSD